MSLRPVIVAVVLTVILAAQTMQAEAAESYKGKGVGVIISKSCQLSSNCLSYGDLIPLDSTNQDISGKFADGKRQPTKYANEHAYYRHANTFTVAVDPTSSFAKAFPRIEIVTQLREYHLPTQMGITEWKMAPDAHATKQVRSYSHIWYVDATCTNAVISAEYWQKLLPQMIYYLQSGCASNVIEYSNVSVEITDRTVHDITKSQKWKHEKWLEEVKKECLSARNSCDVKQPISKS